MMEIKLISSSFLFQVKWMMYWIVFAFFTSFEAVADIFIAFW
jgi:hypothetical protein